MCIYYKYRSRLTYDDQEHIFPAALGGKSKLPIGYVSHEFNHDISKLEQEFIRESLIAIPRQFEGPGKRGRLGEKHAIKSKVLLTIDGEKSAYSLCYLKLGRFNEIPFIEIDVTTGFNQFHMPVQSAQEAQAGMEQFRTSLEVPERLKLKRVTDERLPVGRILFGIMPGVEENFDCFVFKNNATEYELQPQIVKAHLLNYDFGKGMPTRTAHDPSVEQTVTLKQEYLRVYGKIAFNFFAHVYRLDVAMHDMFDPLRDWINGNDKKPRAGYVLNSADDPFPELTKRLSTRNHSVFLFSEGQHLIARVALYFLPVHVLLADNFTGTLPPSGMVVNWSEGREIPMSLFLKKTQNQ